MKQIVADISGKIEGSTLAVAESCTGGLLGAAVTARPGVSAWFRGGVIAYHNQVKIEMLGVDPAFLEQFGAVSAECARAMSHGVRTALGSNIGLAVTGVAGPGGGSVEKPVGTVFVAISGRQGEICRRFQFSGDRKEVRSATVREALTLLQEWLSRPA